MEPVVNREVRQLCKAVAEEQEPMRVKQLLDQLLDILDERLLMASLFRSADRVREFSIPQRS